MAEKAQTDLNAQGLTLVHGVAYVDHVSVEKGGTIRLQKDADPHVKFDELLDAAHRLIGIKSLEVTHLHIAQDLMAVQARVTFADGTVYSDVSEAIPAKERGPGGSAPLRMASTRAIGRCLRHRLNIGVAFEEEKVGDWQPARGQQEQGPPRPAAPTPQRPPAPQKAQEAQQAPDPAANARPSRKDPETIEEAYSALRGAQILINNHFGVIEQVEDGMDLEKARARLAQLRAEYAKLQAKAQQQEKQPVATGGR